jgi:Flp pilus assembly protein TadD
MERLMTLKTMAVAGIAALAVMAPTRGSAEPIFEPATGESMSGSYTYNSFAALYGTPESFADSAARQYAIAARALQAGDYAAAVRAANRMAQLALPDDLRAVQMLGAAQLADRQWYAARRTYARALRSAPGNPVLRAGHGVSLARLGNPRARRELAWLTAKIQACGDLCPEAARLKSLTGEVERAMAGV